MSVAAALTLSPAGRHVGLHYRTYPGGYVDAPAYAAFLRGVPGRARSPVVLVHDRGTMHRGDPMRALLRDFPRLDVNLLPPYAPELNPVEHLWNFTKDKELSNFVPHDVTECDADGPGMARARPPRPAEAPVVLPGDAAVLGPTDIIFPDAQ